MELNSTEILYEADIYSYIFLVLFLKFTPATTLRRTVSKNLCSACIIDTSSHSVFLVTSPILRLSKDLILSYLISINLSVI